VPPAPHSQRASKLKPSHTGLPLHSADIFVPIFAPNFCAKNPQRFQRSDFGQSICRREHRPCDCEQQDNCHDRHYDLIGSRHSQQRQEPFSSDIGTPSNCRVNRHEQQKYRNTPHTIRSMVSGAYGKPDQRPASTASGRCPAGSSKVRKGMEPNNGRIHRLSRLGSIVKERASLVWKSASAHLRRVWLWLTVPRDPVDWKGALAKAGTWLQLLLLPV
jgi:hypothetical protein